MIREIKESLRNSWRGRRFDKCVGICVSSTKNGKNLDQDKIWSSAEEYSLILAGANVQMSKDPRKKNAYQEFRRQYIRFPFL